MLYGGRSNSPQINTKHTNSVWAKRTVVNVRPVGESRNQQALKG